MSKQNKYVFKNIAAGAALLFALSLSLTSLAGAAPQKASPVPKVAIHRGRVSPPHAGVRLLEDILTRMRNLPQIAMSRNKQTYRYQQVAQNAPAPQGKTDQLLAIKPKENPLKEKAESKRRSTLAMALPSSEASYASRGLASDDYAKDNVMGKMSRSNSLAKYNAGPSVKSSYQSSDTVQYFGGQSPREVYVKPQDQPKPLATSIGNLFNATSGLSKKMEEAQRIAQAPSATRQSAPGAGGAAKNSQLADERHSGIVSFRGDKAKIISTNPYVTEYDKGLASAGAPSSQSSQGAQANSGSIAYDEEGEAKSAVNSGKPMPPPAAAPLSAMQAESSAYPQKPPAEPSLFKHVREFLNQNEKVVAGASTGNRAETAAIRDKIKSIEIALLPPSVVTGIPLVRLGTSETETSKALAGKGAVNKTQVNDWSVWSLQKPGNDDVSLQIYSRNGQVEAIRIFDSSLISPDFGVKLGDDLGTVKHKFGEPAFILSEPQSRGGQNYVYPISQVSFQLAYTSKSTAPKVVSLLIFNAK